MALTAPPSRKCGCSCSAWPGGPDARCSRRCRGRPARRPARGLGDDGEVGRHAVARAGQPADAAGLLVGVGADDEVAAQAAARDERLGGDDHRRDAALHVARAAADDPAVDHLGVERVVVPAVLHPRRDDVDVPVEQQRAAAAAAGEPRRELRPALEADPLARQRVAATSSGDGSQTSTSAPPAAQPLGERLCSAASSRAGSSSTRGSGVEADEVAGERDEVVPARGDPRRRAPARRRPGCARPAPPLPWRERTRARHPPACRV